MDKYDGRKLLNEAVESELSIMHASEETANRCKERIDIMRKATYAEGVAVNIESRTKKIEKWERNFHPTWNWTDFDFRIKEIPPLVPFDRNDNLNGKEIRRKSEPKGTEFLIVAKGATGVAIGKGHTDVSYVELAKDWEFTNGLPCVKTVGA